MEVLESKELERLGFVGDETPEFLKFWDIVQDAAKRKNAVFIIYSLEGHSFAMEGIEGEESSGWLVPIEEAENFANIWRKTRDKNDLFDLPWGEYFVFTACHIENDEIVVEFKPTQAY